MLPRPTRSRAAPDIDLILACEFTRAPAIAQAWSRRLWVADTSPRRARQCRTEEKNLRVCEPKSMGRGTTFAPSPGRRSHRFGFRH